MTIEEQAEDEASLRSIIRSKDFLLLYMISCCHMFYGYYIINMFKTLGAETIHDDYYLTIVGSVGSLFDGVSRICWSSLLDYYPFNLVYRTLLVIQIFLIALLLWSTHYPFLYMIVISLSMMCEGAMTSILPTETLTHFKEKRGHQIYGYMFSSFGVSALLGSLIVRVF